VLVGVPSGPAQQRQPTSALRAARGQLASEVWRQVGLGSRIATPRTGLLEGDEELSTSGGAIRTDFMGVEAHRARIWCGYAVGGHHEVIVCSACARRAVTAVAT
jgi:hypothetical protein